MTISAPAPIDTGPPVPDSSLPEPAFDDQFEASLTWQRNVLTPGANALAANVYGNAQDVVALAGDAQSAANAAAASAAAAAISAGVAVWVSGQAYAQYEPAIDPVNLQVYRRRAAGSSATRPALDPATWEPQIVPLPVQRIGSNTTAAVNAHYIITANLTLTLPTSPPVGGVVRISNVSGLYGSQIVPGGTDKIRGQTGAREYNSRGTTDLVWSGATDGWV